MARKQLKIGLFGFGVVGHGLHEVLQRTPALKAEIKRICVRDPHKKRSLDDRWFTLDKNELLLDPEINTIVELIDDADAAFDIVSTALRQGKAVVTANKKMISEHFNELLALQRQYGVPLLYEAACCASIPIIRNLEEYYDNDLLDSIEGIVNGSTNYILTKTAEENLGYAEALREAQQKGYAESDPTLDTGGFDAKYKLQILIAHAFGIVAPPEAIFNWGIDTLGPLELAYAREKGLKIKLVAHAEKTPNGQVRAFVMPKFIPPSDKLYAVDDVFNGVKTKSYFSDTQFFVGKGAGAYPTASAVLSDISALSYDYRYEYKKHNQQERLASPAEVLLRVLLRHDPDLSGLAGHWFEDVEESYVNRNAAYLIGTITLENIQDLRNKYPGKLSLVLFDTLNEAPVSKISAEFKNAYQSI